MGERDRREQERSDVQCSPLLRMHAVVDEDNTFVCVCAFVYVCVRACL